MAGNGDGDGEGEGEGAKLEGASGFEAMSLWSFPRRGPGIKFYVTVPSFARAASTTANFFS